MNAPNTRPQTPGLDSVSQFASRKRSTPGADSHQHITPTPGKTGLLACPWFGTECIGPECSLFVKIDEQRGACSVRILAEAALQEKLLQDLKKGE